MIFVFIRLYLASEYICIYQNLNLYILSRFHKLRIGLTPFHAIWVYAGMMFFGVSLMFPSMLRCEGANSGRLCRIDARPW